jgi:hypothetical protein
MESRIERDCLIVCPQSPFRLVAWLRQIVLDTLIAPLLASSRGKRLREIHRQVQLLLNRSRAFACREEGSVFGVDFCLWQTFNRLFLES